MVGGMMMVVMILKSINVKCEGDTPTDWKLKSMQSKWNILFLVLKPQ